MSHSAQRVSTDRNRMRKLARGSKSVLVPTIALAAIATGASLYWCAERPHAESTVTTHAQPRRDPPEALAVLTELRSRFGSVPQRPEDGTSDGIASRVTGSGQRQAASGLLPAIASDLESSGGGFFAQFAHVQLRPDARVTVPAQASGPFELEETSTGMRVSARLEGVQGRAAELADGYTVYRDAFGANTTVLRRVMSNGTEDFVSFADAPKEPMVTYRVELDASVAGLRHVGNSVELLDTRGTPRLRVTPPYIVSADGQWVEAKLALNGCAADTNMSAPWERAVTAPGATSCQLRVSWEGSAVKYPALLDPTWMTTGSMATARQGHTATLLADGKVLAAGGTNGTTVLATAELYAAPRALGPRRAA